MRAVQVVDMVDGGRALALTDVQEPRVGPGEVLIQVQAVSASRLDQTALRGVAFGRAVELPRTLGGDPAGRVVAVGAGVDPTRVGEVVVVKPNLFCGACPECAAGREADCADQQVLGVHRDGGAAELVAVPSRSAFPVPTGVDPLTAAAAVHTLPVALHMLRIAGGVPVGAPVLVTGAAGAVGSAAVSLVRELGGCPLAVVQDAGQEAFVTGLGPVGVVRLDRESLVDGAGRLASAGVALVVDTTGVAAVFSAAIETLARGGHAVTVSGGPGQRATFDMGALYRMRRTIHGSAASDVADVVDALALVEAGRVEPRIGVVHPLHEYRSAYAALDDPGRTGKVLIEVSP